MYFAKNNGFSFQAFSIPANPTEDMDDKLFLLNKAAFFDHKQTYQDYPEYIRNIEDQQIEICRGVLSYSLDAFLTATENLSVHYNTMEDMFEKDFIKAKSDFNQAIKKIEEIGYTENRVQQLIGIFRVYVSVVETIAIFYHSDNKKYKNIYDKSQAEYNEEQKNYTELLCKLTNLIKNLPDLDLIKREEIEKVNKDKNNKRIEFSPREILKLKSVLGEKHDRSHHLNEVKAGKESYYTPLGEESIKYVKEQFSLFLENYLLLCGSSSYMYDIRIAQALNMLSYPEKQTSLLLKKDGLQNAIFRDIKERRRMSAYETFKESNIGIYEREAESNVLIHVRNIKLKIKKIMQLDHEIQNCFDKLTNTKSVILRFIKNEDNFIGRFNNEDIKDVLLCLKVEEYHYLACLVPHNKVTEIKTMEDAKKMNVKQCSFHSMENLITEIKTDMARTYFYPQVESKFDVMVNF